MAKTTKIPERNAVDPKDTWDLTKLIKSDTAWERAYKKLERMIPTFETFKGKLGRSAKAIRACCDYENEFEELADKLGVYAYLKASENVRQTGQEKENQR